VICAGAEGGNRSKATMRPAMMLQLIRTMLSPFLLTCQSSTPADANRHP
jgi:hypothetical protein